MNTLTCALQIGSSQIKAVAATCDELGRYEVLAYECEPTDGCICHGSVKDIDSAANHTRILMQKLNNRVKQLGFQGLNAAYVGIGGMPLQRLPRHTALQLASIANHEGFNLANEQLLLADIQAVMQRAGVRMAGFVTLPLAIALLLSENERQQGVVLVDMGATTTTVCIYKGNSLQHLAILPLGGDCVTSDLTFFPMADNSRLDRSEAERVKCELIDVSGDYSALPKPIISAGDIAICRYEEIAANILNQIRRSGINIETLSCVITGGASMQRGLTTLFSRRLGIRQICVRSYDDITFGGSERKPQQAAVMAMLKYCTISCEAPVPAPEPIQTTITFDDDEPETPSKEETTEAATEAETSAAESPVQEEEKKEDEKPQYETEDRRRSFTFGSIFKDLFGGANDGK